ncbi:iron chelate uptake ABC transporter family permease subunit [Paenibacillus sp. FJAT-26967]|uniref:iron chelate uptake ABC transporter family permease subunit n=1 Tax=Paenibacillus sp. FJAT-26967 TaxID=1729690 RepID=UPI0008388FED
MITSCGFSYIRDNLFRKGSAVGVAIVFGLDSLLPNGLIPVHMAVVGTVIGTFLSCVSAAQNISFWHNSRLHQLEPDLIWLFIPFAIIGIITALLLSRSIAIISLGEEVAVNLGMRTLLIK